MAASHESGHDETPISSVQQLAGDVVTLVRQEVELAKSELAEKAKAAGAGAGMLSASAVTGLLTLGTLTALGIVALALVLPMWLAVLVLMLFWAAVTLALAFLGRRKVEAAVPFVPERTIKNLKEDVEWARRGGR